MSKRESFGSTMDTKLLNDLREMSKETDIPISKLIDRAVSLLLKESEKSSNNKNDSN